MKPGQAKPTRASARPGTLPGEWHSRGYLPHRDRAGLIQSITFRLADSLPKEKLAELEQELREIPENRRDAERRRKIEGWLDSGMGCCALRDPEVAAEMQRSLLHFHGEQYEILAWCIMPNHVHVMLETTAPIATIVQGWKSVTARWALARNEALGLKIPDSKHFWMRDYWDRYIRDRRHYDRALDYIHRNPVVAGLCRTPEAWPRSSAAPGNADALVGIIKPSPTEPTHDETKPNEADKGVGAPGETRKDR